MSRWLTEEEQRAWRGLLRMTSQLNARANRLLQEEYGISLADYEVLVALSEAPEGRHASLCKQVADEVVVGPVEAETEDPHEASSER